MGDLSQDLEESSCVFESEEKKKRIYQKEGTVLYTSADAKFCLWTQCAISLGNADSIYQYYP